MTILALLYAAGFGLVYHRAVVSRCGRWRAVPIAAVWPVAAALCIRDRWRG
jgi:hypothetical protein